MNNIKNRKQEHELLSHISMNVCWVPYSSKPYSLKNTRLLVQEKPRKSAVETPLMTADRALMVRPLVQVGGKGNKVNVYDDGGKLHSIIRAWLRDEETKGKTFPASQMDGLTGLYAVTTRELISDRLGSKQRRNRWFIMMDCDGLDINKVWSPSRKWGLKGWRKPWNKRSGNRYYQSWGGWVLCI